MVSLFILFIKSSKQRLFVYFVCLGIKDISQRRSSPNLHSAPLNTVDICYLFTYNLEHKQCLIVVFTYRASSFKKNIIINTYPPE